MGGDEGGFELEREGEIVQARQFPRALLRDARISFGAKGLFVFLWDLPTDWRVRSSHLATIGPQRKDAIRRLLAELEGVGALRVEAVRGEQRGRLAGKKWVLRAPQLWAVESSLSRRPEPEAAPNEDLTEGRESRSSEDPKVGEAAARGLRKREVFSASAGKKFRVRPCGIVTWDADDLAEAKRIEAAHTPEAIAAAVEAVAAVGKQPVPGLVVQALRRAEVRSRPAPQLRIAEKEEVPATPNQIENVERMRAKVRSKIGVAP